MVAVRAALPVLVVKVAVIAPLFVPLAGERVSQVWLSVAVQVTLELTLNVVLPAEAPTFWVAGVTVRVEEELPNKSDSQSPLPNVAALILPVEVLISSSFTIVLGSPVLNRTQSFIEAFLK